MEYKIVTTETVKIYNPYLKDLDFIFDSYDKARNYFNSSIAVGNRMYYTIVPVSD